jgi:hypothetical protein
MPPALYLLFSIEKKKISSYERKCYLEANKYISNKTFFFRGCPGTHAASAS